jgi:predicted amidohydrolase YtcJ
LIIMQIQGAERIFHNGRVITLDAASTICSAIAVRGDRILATGNENLVRAAAHPMTEMIDLGGKVVIPGLVDSHAHMDREGLKDVYPSLAGAKSIDGVLTRIAELVKTAPRGAWIVTMPIGQPPSYWNVPDNLAERRWPNRHDLDQVAPDNPVYIRPIWGFWRHKLPLVSIANSCALERCGIDRSTLAPAPSVIIEKDASGNPTGVFTEWTYMSIVELTLMRAAGQFSRQDRIHALKRSMETYNSFGTTAVFEEHGVSGEILAAYRKLREHGPLSVRASLLFSPPWSTVPGIEPKTMLSTWGAWLGGRGFGDDYLRAGGLYVMLEDETEGPRSKIENTLRASASPYTGWAGFYYDSGLPRERLKQVLIAAANEDIRCVGLTADLIDLYAEVDRIVPIRDKRWVLGHVSVLSKEQIAKIRDLGLALSTHTNRYIWRTGSHVAAALGPERESEISPLASLKAAGVQFGLATDNVPASMFYPIWQSVARKDRITGRTIAPSEKLDRLDALRAATLGGAYLTGDERDRGSLETGKLADFACLSDDPLRTDEDAIKDIVADFVVVGGRMVFERKTSHATGRTSANALAK